MGDLDGGGFVELVMPVAGVGPVFGGCDEATRNGVVVHVVELVDDLVVGEDIEVVITGEPEWARN